MKYQFGAHARTIAIFQLLLSLLCFVFGVLTKVYGSDVPYLMDTVAPGIWCSVFALAAAWKVLSTINKPTYTKLFWSNVTNWTASFFQFFVVAIQVYSLTHLLIAGKDFQTTFVTYAFISVGLVTSFILLLICVHNAKKFGRLCSNANSADNPEYFNDMTAISADTGATLVKISVLAIALSIPAVYIAYGEPYDYTYLARVGAGIWCSVMSLVAGALCYKSVPTKNNAQITATFAFGIIASVFATCELGVEVGAAVQCLMYQGEYPEMQTTFQVHMIVSACAMYQLALSIFIAVTYGKMNEAMLAKVI
uniref:Membrane-spanning 4-domains subfamily A member 8 n=1 Tax=Phallusia mammillata TaxID=59560 RepID=A0A6F9DKQ5_9ASCI|nr:membrane-spanning 4-domains subfamily A member 8 [Phallusia mammillata]